MKSLTTIISPQSSTIEDWATFYADLEKKAANAIPNASKFIIEGGKITFSSTYLNLKEIKDKLYDVENIVNVILYADTLEIPEYTNWVINSSSLYIYARNIVTHENTCITLDYQDSRSEKLIVFGRELSSKIKIKCIFDTTVQPEIFYLDKDNITPGSLIGASKNNAYIKEISLNTGINLFPKQEFTYYINNLFIYASLLYDQESEIALSMFLWIKGWASESNDFQELFYRSTSISSLLNAEMSAKENGARFIPYLTSTIYEKLSAAFAEAAAKYESDYMILSMEENLTEENIEMAKTMVANTEDEINFVQALLEQAKENSNNANEAAKAALTNFNTQKTTVDATATKFETIGIPDYKRKVIISGMFDIIGSIVTFGASIGLMAIGDPLAAGSAASSVTSVKKVAESGVEAAQLASSLAETMENLKDLVETIEKAIEIANAVKSVMTDMSTAENQMSTIQKLDDYYNKVDMSSATDWTVFQIQASNAMKDPIDLKIEFAKEYDEAMQILAVYGQALSAAQLASMKADQELAALFFQLHYTEEKKKNLEELIAKLEVGQEATLEVMQQFYQKYLDSKCSLFSALKSYQQSYFFWALQESTICPKIIDDVDTLNTGLNDLTQIQIDKASALNKFDPPPQDMNNAKFVINNENILKSLKENNQAHWTVPINGGDFNDFNGFERVRLDRIRVWLEGVKFENGHNSVSISITNSGNYLDQYNGLQYQFNSKSLERAFKYSVVQDSLNTDWVFDNDSYGQVMIDGEIDDEVKYAYFRPTPFSEWKISIKPERNPGVDFSEVTKITMDFAGTTILPAIKSLKSLTSKKKENVS